MKHITRKTRITGGILLVLALLLTIATLISEEVKQPVLTQLSGTVTWKNDQYILQSGKTRLMLAILPPDALDSLKFRPQTKDAVTVTGYKSKGSFVCTSAIWKDAVYTFRDSLNVPVLQGTSTWKADKKTCIGCRLCFNNCPVNAITMVEVSKGTFRSQIDQTKCVGCNTCIAGNGSDFQGCPVKAISK